MYSRIVDGLRILQILIVIGLCGYLIVSCSDTTDVVGAGDHGSNDVILDDDDYTEYFFDEKEGKIWRLTIMDPIEGPDGQLCEYFWTDDGAGSRCWPKPDQ